MSTFQIPLTVAEQELSSRVESLHDDIIRLSSEVLEIANRISAWPTPPRTGWERYTYVEEEEEDPQLTRPPDSRIKRVTLSADGTYVTAYGHDDQRLEAFCGTMDTVGWALLAISGNLLWERLPPVYAPETPPPLSDETEPQLSAIGKIA